MQSFSTICSSLWQNNVISSFLLIYIYYIAQVTSSKIARCDWLLTWRDFSVMPAGIMQTVNALWTKTSRKSFFFPLHFALKLKYTEMSDEEHSDSEFYYPEEQETAERKATVVRPWSAFWQIKFEALKRRHRYEKLVLVVLIFVIKSAV